MELRRREHARSVGVLTGSPGRVPVRRERCEFTGGRDDLGDDRGSTLFSGTQDGPVAPEPPWPAGHEEIERRLAEFIGWIGGDVVLQHRAVATGRCAVTGAGAVSEGVRTVFALTGKTVTENGRTLPIGLSGRGNGLAVLEDRALAETMAWTRGALASAAGPVRGRPPAVLSPQAAAVLLHEAVGHYAEAMHVGAPAVHRLFTRIAGECLSVVDEPDPDEDSDRRHHDDEGVLSLGSTQVVRRGVLVAQLHSRETARAAATMPTGNARAAQVWDSPIPRVSNLVCATGQRPERALVGELTSGVYVHRLADGYRQGTRVSAHIVLGEYIRQGRRTGHYFTGSQVDGKLDLLTDLAELGNQAERSPNAMCGKAGQLLFDVGTVTPAMRLSALSLVS
ncbi:metallopeptidase TldD-related protein [Amycolatopsis nigrescens]|uniref:metallopeptidase TldD-related protein n=1 Tax=Amycolatopsis nigrescens TaxID=381445 RepID=UPI0003644E62|nr:metallopeptidase TldD-related protein [Amycolatopsis nigrescens]